MILHPSFLLFFFFNDTATTEIYTLSLHDALPICSFRHRAKICELLAFGNRFNQKCIALSPDGAVVVFEGRTDRKSTRLNSSHDQISYAVFCLKKKKRRKRIM